MHIFGLRPKFQVGLDISPPWIRLLLLKHTQQGFVVEGFRVAEISSQDSISAIVNRLIVSCGITNQPTVIALAANQVVSKRIKLPRFLNAFEVENQIAVEIKQHVPGIADELCFDIVNMGLVDGDHHDILLIATRQELLNNSLASCSSAGLNIRCVDIDIYALARAVLWCLQPQKNLKTFAIIDIAATTTQLIFIADKKIVFQQLLNFGMAELKSVTASAGQFLLNLQLQIKRSVEQYFSHPPETVLQQIILTGECSQLPGLGAAMQGKLAIATSCLNPFATMKIADTVNQQELTSLAPTLLTCCGLAMRSI